MDQVSKEGRGVRVLFLDLVPTEQVQMACRKAEGFQDRANGVPSFGFCRIVSEKSTGAETGPETAGEVLKGLWNRRNMVCWNN